MHAAQLHNGRWRPAALFGLLAPGLLAGCGLFASTPTPGATPQPSGSSWLMIAPGNLVPSPSVLATGSPSASPSGYRLWPTWAARPAGTYPPSCAGVQRLGQINGLTTVMGPGTAVVSWFNPGGGNLVSYRLTAIPQRLVAGKQPALKWQTIPPGAPCATMSATVTGLKRKAPYMFSLDVWVTNLNSDGVRTSTIARSLVVYTT